MAAGSFLAISDIHFDPFENYSPWHSPPPPPDVTDLLAAPAVDWPHLLAKTSTSIPGKGADANYLLMKEAFDHAQSVAPNVDFIVYPGDFLRHDIWPCLTQATKREKDQHGNEVSVKLTTAEQHSFIAKMGEVVLDGLTSRFPGKPVFMTFGNDDSFIADYLLDTGFLAAMAGPCRSALGSAVDSVGFASFPTLGSYMARLPGTSTRLISIANVSWSTSAGASHQDDAVRTFLDQQLKAAAAAGDKVWLLMHIPPGSNGYVSHRGVHQGPNWSSGLDHKFQVVLDSHDVEIEVAFCGHTHMDDFRFGTHKRGAKQDLLMYKIVPGVSPKFGQHPGFQVFTTDNGTISDWTTYYHDRSGWAAANTYAATAQYSYTDTDQLFTLFGQMRAGAPGAATARSHYANDYKLRRYPPLPDNYVDTFIGIAVGPAGAYTGSHVHHDIEPTSIEQAMAMQLDYESSQS